MKALFLSVTAGCGHNSAAKSVMSHLEEKGFQCALLDTFEYINPVLSESISKCNFASTKFTPGVYHKLYRLAEKKSKKHSDFSVSKLISSILSKKLIKYISDFKPDVIVCTHVFSAQIVTAMKKKNISVKSIGIITDFTVHPFWEETDLDYYVTANELLNFQVERKGISLDKVLPIGIPIHKKFSKKIGRQEAREILGIEDKTSILIMSGGTGHGSLLKLIRKLDKLDMNFQILSVCGSNKKLKKKIDKFVGEKKVYNYGYIDNVDLMMDAADCIITKPGGLTISESLAKELPLILMKPIPGQEERNAEFLLNNGLAVKITPTFIPEEAVFQLLIKSSKYKNSRDFIKSFGKPDSSKDLGEFIETLVKDNKTKVLSGFHPEVRINKNSNFLKSPLNFILTGQGTAKFSYLSKSREI
jgi:processive 1,2-diacylglycerol beta-glucosyltransferase